MGLTKEAIKAKERGRQIGMAQGLCIAIAEVIRLREVRAAREIWQASGLTIEECEKLKVEDYDLDEIRKHIHALE